MSATFIEVHAALADAAKRGARWASLSMSEEIAMSAALRRIAAMVVDGATTEDWQQLAGYADWAAKRPPEMPTLANATVHGQWIEWHGEGRPALDGMTNVEVRKRNYTTAVGRVATWEWSHDVPNVAGDIVAYRIAD